MAYVCDIISKYDLLHSDGFEFPIDNRVNMVVGNFRSRSDGWFEVDVFIPEGVSSACCLKDFLKFRCGTPTSRCLIHWPACKPAPVDARYLLIDVDASNHPESYALDERSIPLTLGKPSDGDLRVLELCAGGFGGWHRSLDFLSCMFDIPMKVLSVELNLQAALSFAISHGVPLVSGFAPLPLSLVERFQHLVLHADVSSNVWLEFASHWQSELLCISSPCQPWSSAGSEGGLDSSDGHLMVDALVYAKLLRPRVVVFEQVAGFALHPHRPHILKILRCAGFKDVFARTVDVSDVAPVHRLRYLLIAVRTEDPCTAEASRDWSHLLRKHQLLLRHTVPSMNS